MTSTLRLGDKGHAVRDLQAGLKRAGASLYVDGDFGEKTEAAVMAFQLRAGLVVDGLAGTKTFQALAGSDCSALLKEADLVRAADRLGADLAAVKAVNEVESRGEGFFAPGKPAILFERHIMRRRLLLDEGEEDLKGRVASLEQAHPGLINKRPGGYAGGLAEYPRLARAKMIDTPCAIESASWGLFQIMGFHWKNLGYDSAPDFEAAMQASEANHLDAFVRFIEADPALHKALKAHKWTAFARIYNGPAYARNLYDVKLQRAYARHAEHLQAAA
ncbi:Peptidoglycan-binding (PGRP) domain of peptidoglycan hydrolases-containing protein [Halopseudomonas litoralis]|uniref:Peptidoglycan-binding (PGRP) domain of peptidoglycan hydrolases-containing protein n=1 Tax=Halopseudomonas litoralis TaxID=797277 RepID=A0A1H1SQS3_9GAMM|nr:N-acetylmuramidase family protein [Halopseudomonas litoralis]SDS50086.1 Peptidoglycan-binding (PGRP) domain of peptidoglycan hydrolases-containing protein [Halopseudomonas litoralis]